MAGVPRTLRDLAIALARTLASEGRVKEARALLACHHSPRHYGVIIEIVPGESCRGEVK